MHIVIIGSGIGGLTAAVVLRREGHNVTVLEQSHLSQETGAAIFLPPNVNDLLRKYSFVPEDHGANYCLAWRQFSAHGTLELDAEFTLDQYPSPWQMIHRQHLHSGLKQLAEDPRGHGHPAHIITGWRAIDSDPDLASVTCEDGSQINGDLLIGADGVHSTSRAAVLKKYDSSVKPFSAGYNCFRFLIPREELLTDPTTKSTFQVINTFTVWAGEDRKLVCYPCDANETMNFVAIHPAKLSHTTDTTEWNSQGSKATLISIYGTFAPVVQSIISHAKEDQLRMYPLMDMEVMAGWTNKRLALLGDAAHHFLPHLGQGGAQAIEDALSLGVFLSAGTKSSEVPERLALYEQARKERAERIQQATRTSGLDRSILANSDFDFEAAREYQFRHDEVLHSREILRKTRFS